MNMDQPTSKMSTIKPNSAHSTIVTFFFFHFVAAGIRICNLFLFSVNLFNVHLFLTWVFLHFPEYPQKIKQQWVLMSLQNDNLRKPQCLLLLFVILPSNILH